LKEEITMSIPSGPKFGDTYVLKHSIHQIVPIKAQALVDEKRAAGYDVAVSRHGEMGDIYAVHTSENGDDIVEKRLRMRTASGPELAQLEADVAQAVANGHQVELDT
jgi:hypothetical protein